MKRFFPVLVFLLGLGSCLSSGQAPASSSPDFKSPLDSYIDGLRKRQMNSAAAEFTTICGVKLDEAAKGDNNSRTEIACFTISLSCTGTDKANNDATQK